MNKSNLWSLRLGFSGKQAQLIEQLGFEKFLNQSYATTFEKTLPTFLDDEPKSLAVPTDVSIPVFHQYH